MSFSPPSVQGSCVCHLFQSPTLLLHTALKPSVHKGTVLFSVQWWKENILLKAPGIFLLASAMTYFDDLTFYKVFRCPHPLSTALIDLALSSREFALSLIHGRSLLGEVGNEGGESWLCLTDGSLWDALDKSTLWPPSTTLCWRAGCKDISKLSSMGAAHQKERGFCCQEMHLVSITGWKGLPCAKPD